MASGCITNSELKTRWWMHRDQKLQVDETRDNVHLRECPDAFCMERCYQSSVYFTDSKQLHDDSFICCPGSQNWPDADGWVSSGDRHNVSVPADDPRVMASVSKLIIERGEMIVWDSRLAHMGGYLSECKNGVRKGGRLIVKMLRLPSLEYGNKTGIKKALETDGVALIKDIANGDEIISIKEQLCMDIASIYGVEQKKDWESYSPETYGRTSKGGGSWGAICCSEAVWRGRLLPRRVTVFKDLLKTDNIVVSIDSVHWSVGHSRLAIMASFCAEEQRSSLAFKIKCVSQAYGLTRTTHWACFADISGFNYGADRDKNPQARLDAISTEWNGFGCVLPCGLPDISKVGVRGLKKFITQVATSLNVEEAGALLDIEVSRWL